MEIITLKKKGISDFAKERNRLLSKSKSKWVFFLDSDERLSGYKIERKNYFLGKYIGTDKLIRLVKKGWGKWVRRVHETYHPRGGTRVGELKNPYIIHNTAKNLHDYIAKINFYSTLHAQANRKEGKKSILFKIVFYPTLKFFVELVKSKHLVFSIMQSLHSFLSWSKLYFLRS